MPFMEMVARVGLDGSAVQAGLTKIKGAVRSAASSMASTASGFAKSQLGAAIGVAAVLQFARSTIAMGGQISDTATRLGISAEEVQKWTYAATQSGATAEDVTSFFEKLAVAKQKAIQGDKAAIQSFKALGVSMDDLKSKSIGDIGIQVGKAFEGGGPTDQLLPSLKNVGGGSAGAMIAPMASGLQTSFDKAIEAGVIMSDKGIADLDAAGDAMDTFLLQLRTLFVGAIPFLTGVGTAIKVAIAALTDALYITLMTIPNLLMDAFKFITTGTFGSRAKEGFTDSFTKRNIDIDALEKKTKTDEEEIKSKEAKLKAKPKSKRAADAAASAAATTAEKVTASTATAAAATKKGANENDLQKSFLNFQQIQRDSLSKIGGFTFARESENLAVAKKQVELLEKIETNTQGIDEINNVDDGL